MDIRSGMTDINQKMETATFYVICPDHTPSSIKCILTSVGLKEIYRLVGPTFVEIEFFSLPSCFRGLHIYVDGMGEYDNLRPNTALAKYTECRLLGNIIISRLGSDGEDVGVSPMDVHMLDKMLRAI